MGDAKEVSNKERSQGINMNITNVTDDGIQCQRCEIWFHFGSCSDVEEWEDLRKEYRNRNKKFKCTECEKEKRGPGRPKQSKRKTPIKCKVPTRRKKKYTNNPCGNNN